MMEKLRQQFNTSKSRSFLSQIILDFVKIIIGIVITTCTDDLTKAKTGEGKTESFNNDEEVALQKALSKAKKQTNKL